MFISMVVLALGMLLFGAYCLNMTNKSDYGWLCAILGGLLLLVGVGLPIMAIVDAFIEEEFVEAIICIVATLVSYFLTFLFMRSLWR